MSETQQFLKLISRGLKKVIDVPTDYIDQWDEDSVVVAMRQEIVGHILRVTSNRYSLKEINFAIVTTVKGSIIKVTISQNANEQLRAFLVSKFKLGVDHD